MLGRKVRMNYAHPSKHVVSELIIGSQVISRPVKVTGKPVDVGNIRKYVKKSLEAVLRGGCGLTPTSDGFQAPSELLRTAIFVSPSGPEALVGSEEFHLRSVAMEQDDDVPPELYTEPYWINELTPGYTPDGWGFDDGFRRCSESVDACLDRCADQQGYGSVACAVEAGIWGLAAGPWTGIVVGAVCGAGNVWLASQCRAGCRRPCRP